MIEINESVHDTVFRLLPWSVNRTLTESEQRLVNEHLQGCPICQKENMLLQASLNKLPQPSPAPDVERSLVRVMNLIDAESNLRTCKQKPVCREKNSLRNFIDWLNSLNGWQQAPLMTMVVALTVLGFQSLQTSQQDEYTLLSSPVESTEPLQLFVQFKREISREVARNILEKFMTDFDTHVNVHYVTSNQYVLTFSNSTTALELGAIVNRLQGNDSIDQVNLQLPE